MSNRFAVPDQGSVKNILGMMFSGIEVEPMESTTLDQKEIAYIASYRDDSGGLVGACACDMDFSAKISAALSLVPPVIAEEAIASGALDENLCANLYEVMNIYSNLMMDSSTPHLKLDGMVAVADSDAELQNCLGQGTRVDYRVSIPSYGQGSFYLSIH